MTYEVIDVHGDRTAAMRRHAPLLYITEVPPK